ncbi:MAG: ATP-binding protein, partial [Candidatus Hodarchaeales archaeon]
MTEKVLKQITVLSGKGGTGKTTITAALAQLSSPNSVVADCDVDVPNLHLLLDPHTISSDRFFSGKIAIKDPAKCINCGKCLEVCRFDVISTTFDIDPVRCEGCGACAWICPKKAITMETQASGTIYEAKSRFGSMVHARLDIGAENSGKLVNEVIRRSHDLAKKLDKDLVIVDGSPGIGCPVISSLTNATLVIIVVEPTSTAIHDMKRVLELVWFFKLQPAIIINKSTINL